MRYKLIECLGSVEYEHNLPDCELFLCSIHECGRFVHYTDNRSNLELMLEDIALRGIAYECKAKMLTTIVSLVLF